ncbi:MAG TPA: maleylacetate reductase [Burkholderiales bacterium]|nr:maleylacetate reductase [Burkholderiales bacterium]
MQSFVYQSLPSRIVFAVGGLSRIGAEMDRLGARRALVLATPEQRADARRVAEILGERHAGVFAEAAMHVPIETARAAVAEAKRLNADCAVTIGGGSTTGLGKAIALESSIPILAVPTTYAGSEVTPIYGLTEGGLKKTGRDPRVLPRTVIYDPQLTVSMPKQLTATSGMNAMAHAVEGLYAADANPIMSLMAEEGIRALAVGLPRAVARPDDIDARADCLYGAWLCGTVLGAVGMALHHKLCHTLGGSFNLPHAETHTVVLPHAAAYNFSVAREAMARTQRALGAKDAASGLFDLAAGLGAPMTLEQIGMRASDLDRAADLAVAAPYPNPRPIERSAIRKLLDDAFYGRRPGPLS